MGVEFRPDRTDSCLTSRPETPLKRKGTRHAKHFNEHRQFDSEFTPETFNISQKESILFQSSFFRGLLAVNFRFFSNIIYEFFFQTSYVCIFFNHHLFGLWFVPTKSSKKTKKDTTGTTGKTTGTHFPLHVVGWILRFCFMASKPTPP